MAGSPNQALLNALNNFQTQINATNTGDNNQLNATYYNTFYNAIVNSPALLSELESSLQTSNQLSGFTYSAAGNGANFNGTGNHTMVITSNFLNQLSNSSASEVSNLNFGTSALFSNVVALSGYTFTIAHEDFHSTTYNQLNSGVTPIWNDIANDAKNGQDVTSDIAAYSLSYVNDEAQANIQGWNAVISMALANNNSQALAPGQITALEQNAGGAYLFFNAAGQPLNNIKVNADGTISASLGNISAESSIVGETPISTSYGSVISYNQLYSSYGLSQALANSNGNPVQFNLGNVGTLSNGAQLSDAQVIQNMGLLPGFNVPSNGASIHFTDGTIATFSASTVTPSGISISTVNIGTPSPQIDPVVEPVLLPTAVPNLDITPPSYASQPSTSQSETIKTTDTSTGATNSTYETNASNQSLDMNQLGVQDIFDGGANNTVSNNNSGNTFAFTNGGLSATVSGNGGSIQEGANDFLNYSGANNAVTVGQNSVFADYTGGGNVINGGANELLALGGTNGNFDIVNASGDMTGGTTFNGQGTGVYMSANTQINLQGSGTFVNENTSDTVGAYGGGNEINTAKGELLEIGQTGTSTDTINAANDGTGGSTANGQGTGLVFLASSYGQVVGGDDIVTFDGSGDYLASSSTNIGITQGLTNEVINGSNEVLDIGKDVSVTIYGNNDTVHGATSDDIYVNGTDDVADVQNSIVDFTGSNTGDDVNGTGDSGSDWGGSSGNDGGEYGGYSGYGGYAFSKAPSTSGANIGVIASFDAAMTDQADAQTAQAARLQAEASLSSTSSSYTPVFEGAKWANTTITWSVAGCPDDNGAQLSGTIGSQYVSLIQSAFQTWAAASGLKFQQVTGTTPADIELGWSTFNTGASNVLGYTGFKSMNGTILSGALISLENPADDALTTDANGQLAYTGTQTELEQLILHEIGHALGLADDSDPKSVLNAVLTAANRTLDATDIAGIQALYQPTTIAATTASATAAVTTGLSDIASLASSNPITVASSLISSLTSSVLSPFTTEADQLIGAMAAFSPTASPTAFVPTTLASFASGMNLAAAVGG